MPSSINAKLSIVLPKIPIVLLKNPIVLLKILSVLASVPALPSIKRGRGCVNQTSSVKIPILLPLTEKLPFNEPMNHSQILNPHSTPISKLLHVVFFFSPVFPHFDKQFKIHLFPEELLNIFSGLCSLCSRCLPFTYL